MTFEDFVYDLGLRPTRQIVPGATWTRCPTETHPHKRNGAYRLAEDGTIGWARDHAVHAEAIMWRPDRESAPRRGVRPRALTAPHEREQRAEIVRATNAARAFFAACRPLRGGHPYLEAHGLDMTGCYGLRVAGRGQRMPLGDGRETDLCGWLAVPASIGRNIMTVQCIAPDGTKLFWKGASPKGAAYVIGDGNPITVLCEGLATGLAIYATSPKLFRVVCAFTSGNLPNVAEKASGMVCVASDNDWRTVCQGHRKEGLQAPFQPWDSRPEWCTCNPGRCTADKVAKALGCGFALPSGTGTDFCDMRNELTDTRIANRPYGSRATERDIARAVDAEIAAAMQRAAKFVVPKVRSG